ncbi:MAG: carbohydrate ABC transporter permease [Candidatus Bathyarchaeia archaeon]
MKRLSAGAIIVTLFTIMISIIPLAWVFLSSFKSNAEFFRNPTSFPTSFSWNNYRVVLFFGGGHGEEPLLRFLVNSFLASCITVVGCNLIASLASFCFLLPIRGRKLWFYVLSFGLLIPTSAFMVPYFVIVKSLGLYDTIIGLSLVYTGMFLPLSFLILSTYMRENVPAELVEAAVLDGASTWQCLMKVTIPLSRGGIFAAAVIVFINCWNELLYALLLTQTESARTVQIAISSLVATYAANYPAAFAAIIISIMPIIIIVGICGKLIFRGLSIYVER